jgi:cellobiose-specific phosphotransferase system component IIC
VGRILAWMCGGALLAVILTTWLAPSVFVWWFTPPAGLTMTFDAPKAIQWGMNRLIHAQMISLLVGAVLGLVVGLLLRRRGATPPPRSAIPAPAPQKAAAPQKTSTSV